MLRQKALGLKFVRRIEDGSRERPDYVWMPDDHEVKVVPAPRWMVGRSLQELQLRSRFGINVVAIRSHRYQPARDADVPSPDRVLRRRDILVVVGSHQDIERMLAEGNP